MRNGSFAGALRSGLLLLCLALLLVGCGDSTSSPFVSPEIAAQRAPPANQPDPTQLVLIAIGPADPAIVVGANIGLTATGIARNGSRQDITARVTWASANPAVASFTNNAGQKGV